MFDITNVKMLFMKVILLISYSNVNFQQYQIDILPKHLPLNFENSQSFDGFDSKGLT